MADLEVENTLREIRERVLADTPRRGVVTGTGELAAAVGAEVEAGAANGHGAAGAGEALARMHANLATTARAWSRLPPLLTYRRGLAARLELWLKRLIKRAAHWFTWEQVNFNSAVHHALGDVRSALATHEQMLTAHEQRLATQQQRFAAHERALAAQGQTLAAQGEALAAREQAIAAQEQALARARAELLAALRAEAEAGRARAAELQTRLTQAEARFDARTAEVEQAVGTLTRQAADEASAELRAAVEKLRGELGEELGSKTDARAGELHAEMRERIDGLLEEQRVCFKQLSLAAGESAVMQDRARRQFEARLEALESKE